MKNGTSRIIRIEDEYAKMDKELVDAIHFATHLVDDDTTAREDRAMTLLDSAQHDTVKARRADSKTRAVKMRRQSRSQERRAMTLLRGTWGIVAAFIAAVVATPVPAAASFPSSTFHGVEGTLAPSIVPSGLPRPPFDLHPCLCSMRTRRRARRNGASRKVDERTLHDWSVDLSREGRWSIDVAMEVVKIARQLRDRINSTWNEDFLSLDLDPGAMAKDTAYNCFFGEFHDLIKILVDEYLTPLALSFKEHHQSMGRYGDPYIHFFEQEYIMNGMDEHLYANDGDGSEWEALIRPSIVEQILMDVDDKIVVHSASGGWLDVRTWEGSDFVSVYKEKDPFIEDDLQGDDLQGDDKAAAFDVEAVR